VLEALIAETRGRFPALHDLARELHYRAYDVPFLEKVRSAAYAEVDDNMSCLENDPDGPERADRIRSLVDCSQPLNPMLSAKYSAAEPAMQQLMLEVITRRYYRVRELEHLSSFTVDGFAVAAAQYDWEDARVHVFSTHVSFDQLAEGAAALASTVREVPGNDDVVADFYVWRENHDADAATTRRQVTEVMATALGDQALRRIVVAISGPESGSSMAGVLNLTLRPDGEDGYTEEPLYRDLHPMMAKRLEVWRLDAFELRRIPTFQDIYLFHATARENPRDERLVAMAEVRDLTPIRDDNGVIVRLPELERMFHDVLGPIRKFQARRPQQRRLSWNRVMLYVWPELDLDRDEIERLVSRLAPETEGLGLQRVVVRVRMRDENGKVRPRIIEISNPTGLRLTSRSRASITTSSRRIVGYSARTRTSASSD
jgi:hypothetical protein